MNRKNVPTIAIIGLGQVGTFVSRSLAGYGSSFVLADIDPEPTFVARYGRQGSDIQIEKLDICDPIALENYFARHQEVKTVIVTAGLTGAMALRNASAMRKLSCEGIVNVVKSAVSFDCKKVLLMSSLAVYGLDNECDSLREDVSPVKPKTEYGKALAEMENLVSKYCDEIDITIFRIAGVFGPNRYGYGSHSSCFIEKILYSVANNYPVKLAGSLFDSDDYVYVEDVGAVIAKIALLKEDVLPFIVNVGAGSVTTLGAIVDAFQELFPESSFEFPEQISKKPSFTRPPVDIERLESVFNLKPDQFKDAITRFARIEGFLTIESTEEINL